MSDPADRIPVPTNGHRSPSEDSEGAGPAPIVRPETTVAFSPGQLAIGFGILAGLALLVLGRRRRGGRE